MKASTPINIDGNLYADYLVNLAISTDIQSNVEIGNAVFRVVPVRVLENGVLERRDDHSKSVILSTRDVLDTPEAIAVSKIQQAIQEYIYSKNI